MPPELEGCGLRLDARALSLGYRLGADTLLILLDLAARAVEVPEGNVVAASYREIARRLGVSKDTVGRRIGVLRRAGVVVEHTEHRARGQRFEVGVYLLHLELAGVFLERAGVAA
jgi:DNA-binding transcriptional ArsR family regulator